MCLLLLLVLLCGYDTEAVGPVFDDALPGRNVGELEDQARVVYKFTATDSNDFSCTPTLNPSYGPLTATENAGESTSRKIVYDVKTVLSGSTPGYNETTYTIDLVCTDVASEATTATLSLNVVTADQGIKMTNIAGIETRNAKITGANVEIRDLSTTNYVDSGGDVVAHTMTCDNCNSFFTVDSSSGVVSTTQVLNRCHSSTVNCEVTVTDGNFIVTDNLVIQLTNLNTAPISQTLPATKSVAETFTSGSILIATDPYDPDSGAAVTCTFTVDQTAAESLFELDSSCNLLLKSGQSFNFEETTFYNISVYFDDTFINNGPFVFGLTIADDNEACSFDRSMYYGSATEGVAGSASIDALLSVTDPDAADSGKLEFSLFSANNSERFTVAESTGVLGFATEYDVDNSNFPSTVIITVLATDVGGPSGVPKTCSSQITLTISDINDNTPTFASSYSFTVHQLDSVGSTIGTFIPTDPDSGTNGNVACSGTSTSTYSSYYTITAGCNVILSKKPDFDYGETVSYDVIGVDDGSPSRLTGSVTVVVTYVETTTTTVSTTTTTTEAYNFWEHAENIALFVICLLLGLILLGILLYLCLRWCGACGGYGRSNLCNCRDMCRPREHYRRQVTPETPIRKKRPLPVVEEKPVIEEAPRTLMRRTMVPAEPRIIRALPTANRAMWGSVPGHTGPLVGSPPVMGPARMMSGPPPYIR